MGLIKKREDDKERKKQCLGRRRRMAQVEPISGSKKAEINQRLIISILPIVQQELVEIVNF